MKKLFMLLGILASLAMVSAAWADTLNGLNVSEVTVYDGHTSTGSWYGTQEFREVEPGATQGDVWDFRGMWYDAANRHLFVVAGFDLSKGGGGGTAEPLGDLFIKTGSPSPNLNKDKINFTYLNSEFFADGSGYSYALRLSNTTRYSLLSTSVLNTAQDPLALGSANPWQLLSGESSSTPFGVTYGTLSSSDSTHVVAGDFYAAYDLSWLGGAIGDATFHLSYMCGNDGVNAYIPQGSNVPIPPSVLLLGSGLVGLAYARRRRLFG